MSVLNYFFGSKTAAAEDAKPAALQVNGLPLAKGMSLSQWLQNVRSNPLLDHRTTEALPETADVVIIGGGISGATTALALLQSQTPPKSIVMLEARELCSGATGRNAGHCKPDQVRGVAMWTRIYSRSTVARIPEVPEEVWNGAGTQGAPSRTLDVPVTDEVAEATAKIFEACKAAGGPTDKVEVITDKAEAVKRSRIKSACAVYAWDASTLYPWKLVAHVIKRCLSMGLNLQTWTPALSVAPSSSSPDQWTVTTERGTITTPTVVHCTNAYAGAILPEFAPVIQPRPHMCNRAVPPRAWSGSGALQNSYGVLLPNGALFSINPRCTADGVVLFGGSNPGQGELEKYVDEKPERRTCDGLSNFEPVTRPVREFTQNEFEGWGTEFAPGEGYDYSWSGIIGDTADGVPYVGPVPGKKGQWICAGHNGHGMARVFTCGPALAKLIQGAEWADINLPEVFQITEERLARLQAGEKNFKHRM
ncbi:DAO-domain-containing protein [Schizophyllum commune H4-8]|uniref:FAD dependent oxidoreductase domain-containing protein n=1 Tax=Schizophyllum commune (strain H4-8 / FGSC 9210) TaxID=578458 RepID=D8QK22_SCHCM|nr:DAO-domain-containing protein [Schizophyllum commune H4-8]KAI5885671.1 DAO-domain-containing protein [Schizophyllum commune H4-8]